MHEALQRFIGDVDTHRDLEVTDFADNSDDAGWVWLSIRLQDTGHSASLSETVANFAKVHGFKFCSVNLAKGTLRFNKKVGE